VPSHLYSVWMFGVFPNSHLDSDAPVIALHNIPFW
jgi:hypothetical protein